MVSPTRLSRQLRRLLDLGVIKRVTGTYRYYLTKAGRAATAAAERITAAVIVPTAVWGDLADGAIQRSR
jgi:DNA-binding HxlR family transcriptional regulator